MTVTDEDIDKIIAHMEVISMYGDVLVEATENTPHAKELKCLVEIRIKMIREILFPSERSILEIEAIDLMPIKAI